MITGKNIYVSKEEPIETNKSFPEVLVDNFINEDKSSNNSDTGVLNKNIQRFVDIYFQEVIHSRQNYTPIYVDEIVSHLARFYEKIRKVIDWKDDNVLRRGAIERILKRIFFPKLAGFLTKNYNSELLAETITVELIRSGHLPNNTIPRERVKKVSQSIYKYLYFLEYLSNYNAFEIKQKTNLATFILEIASCEIEEILTNPIKEQGLIKAMSQILDERISIIPSSSLTHEEKIKLIKISTQRSLYHLDDNYIVYEAFKENYPNWHNLNTEEIQEVSKKLPTLWKRIYGEINTPINRKFNAITENVDIVFMLLDDVLEILKDKPQEIKAIFENKEKFIKLITKSYNKRYKTLKKRLLNLAIFSTLSVFLSNWVTFFIIEVPLAKLFYEGFNLFAAIVDFLIPTLVMFFLVYIIKPPREENLQKVVSTTLGFIYNDERQEHYQINIKRNKSSLFSIFMTFIYILTAGLFFTGTAYMFYIAKLPMTSVIFDTFTITLTVFAAVVIRNQSKELNVNDDRGIQDFVLDIVTVPVANVGSFIAQKWKEYNIVAIFFNFIVETPLAAVLDFIQGWSEYIKEKRSELR